MHGTYKIKFCSLMMFTTRCLRPQKFEFLHLTNFKLLSQIEGNSINGCAFFNL